MSIFSTLFTSKTEKRVNDLSIRINELEKRSKDDDIKNPCLNSELGLFNGILRITDNDPMSLSAVFAAINMISNSLATLPISIKPFEKDYKVKSNYVMKAMRQSPLTKFMFMKQLVKDLLIYGNAYAYIIREKDGTPKQLGYLQPSEVTPYYSAQDFFVQYYSSPKVHKQKILPKDMIHLVMNSKDGIMGRGVLDFADESIQTAFYVEKTTKSYFKGNTQTTGVLTVQTDNPNINISDKKLQELKDAWNSGSSKTGEGSTTRILPANMKYQSISGNAQETQLTQTRLYDIQEIARFFNISPILLGDYSKLAYSSIEAAQLEFVVHCLNPYIELIQDEFTRKLVPVDVQDFEYVNLDEEYLLKADKSSLSNYLKTLTSAGILSINEARNMLGYESIDGGDEHYIPFTDLGQNSVENHTDFTDNTNIEDTEEEEK